MRSISIFDMPIHCLTEGEASSQLVSVLERSSGNPYIVYTPNPEILVYGKRHPDYRAIIQQANLLLPDGQGIVWASRGALKHRVTGTDIMLRLLAHANTEHLRVAVVLKPDGLSSIRETENVIKLHYPNCDLTVTSSELPGKQYDIVFVALGFPDQERWIAKRRHTLPGTKLMLAVGGGIDFLTGKQARAPLFFRRLGLEWLWRLIRQPRRIKRIFTAVIIFPWYIMIDRYHHPNV